MPNVKKQNPKPKSRRKKPQGVLDRIAPVSIPKTGITMNLYGKSGAGKTTLACTFPKPLLLIGAEDGTRSVHNVKGVDFVRLNTVEELRQIVSWPDLVKYKTVVLDSASSLQDLVLQEILGLDQLPAQRSWGMATRDQWGQCALQTKEILRSVLNLSSEVRSNVVVIAQEREFNTESESDMLMPYVGSALTPSVTAWLNPACDYICQTFIRQRTQSQTTKVGDKEITTEKPVSGVDFCLRIAPHSTFITKFRSPRFSAEFPEIIANPTFIKIKKLIDGQIVERP